MSDSNPSRDFDNPESADPLVVLGLPAGADEAAIRARYLELVRLHPPERDGEKFRQIQDAYQTAIDPLLTAQRLIKLTLAAPPSWEEVLQTHALNTPRIPTDLLLALGNHPNKS